jgi:hypothetical protein
VSREKPCPHNVGQTCPTSRWRIMRDEHFALGVDDARAGRPYPLEYEDWEMNSQWNYERGRAFGIIAPRDLILKKHGRLTRRALRWARNNRIVIFV